MIAGLKWIPLTSFTFILLTLIVYKYNSLVIETDAQISYLIIYIDISITVKNALTI